MIYIYTQAKYKTTHLNFINKPLSSALHPHHLFGLGDLLVAGPVVPTLAPYVNVLATIMGMPLDFLHFVIGGRLSLLAFCAAPSHGNRYHRTLTCVGITAGVGDGALLSSTGAGDGTLCPSSATLLGGGVPAVASSLAGVLALALPRAGSSSATSVVVATAGCSTGCSVAVCPATLCSVATGSVILELKTLPGSTFEAVLQGKLNLELPH